MANPLSELMKVVHGTGDFSSKLVSLVDREPGALFAKIEGTVVASHRAYTSVQVNEHTDIELNSDLVFCNHSCNPSVVFDMKSFQVRVVNEMPLKAGDDITFFYPSTEWEMQQPFVSFLLYFVPGHSLTDEMMDHMLTLGQHCRCGSENCVGIVRGAKYLDDATLEKYWLNAHVERLVAKESLPGVDRSVVNGKVMNGSMELKN